MTAKKPKQHTIFPPDYRGPLAEELELAIESGSLSKKLLRQFAEKFGLRATVKGIGTLRAELECAQETIRLQLLAIDKCKSALFADHATAPVRQRKVRP